MARGAPGGQSQPASFLNAARPQQLLVRASEAASELVGGLLRRCAGLHVLNARTVLPSFLPASPHELTVRFGPSGLLDTIEPSSVPLIEQQVQQLLRRLPSLPSLTTLQLGFPPSYMLLDGQWPAHTALRQLTVHVDSSPVPTVYRWSALTAAATAGVRVVLDVSFCPAGSCQNLQRCLAGLPGLDELCIASSLYQVVPLPLPVRCREATLQVNSVLVAESMLQVLECEVLHCCCYFEAPVPWSLISSRPGIYALQMYDWIVVGCSGTLPEFKSGCSWALVQLGAGEGHQRGMKDPGVSEGLPLSQFTATSHGDNKCGALGF